MVGLTEVVLLSYSQVEAFATELSQVLEETFLHTNIAYCDVDVFIRCSFYAFKLSTDSVGYRRV